MCDRVLLSDRVEQFTWMTGALCVCTLDVHTGIFTEKLRKVHLSAH